VQRDVEGKRVGVAAVALDSTSCDVPEVEHLSVESSAAGAVNARVSGKDDDRLTREYLLSKDPQLGPVPSKRGEHLTDDLGHADERCARSAIGAPLGLDPLDVGVEQTTGFGGPSSIDEVVPLRDDRSRLRILGRRHPVVRCPVGHGAVVSGLNAVRQPRSVVTDEDIGFGLFVVVERRLWLALDVDVRQQSVEPPG
jgi:hypothetical protein